KGKISSDKLIRIQGSKQIFTLEILKPNNFGFIVLILDDEMAKAHTNRLLNTLRDNKIVFLRGFGEIKSGSEVFIFASGKKTTLYVELKQDTWEEIQEVDVVGEMGIQYYEYLNQPKEKTKETE
ncbi:MAG: hypothetical protein AABZ60_09755, partial [Planctomycetota bacterium]